ncbi:MAG: stage II sporulation protein M [Acidobacteria bacterium]|nr:stage II sporulation protein M [Acidobacteriota bacterium]MBI3663035.1 stage II sporulation protein M [Acidobacteriota bacterium]
MSALTHAELQELGLLYRQAASDLATVREDRSSQMLAQYINQLLARAHNLIYMGRKAGSTQGLVHFYTETYPRIFREHLAHTLVAFIVFAAGALAAFLVSLRDPSFPRYLLSGPMVDTIERQEMWTHSIVTMKPLASSAIMTNNLGVAFVTFAMGITAGLGTLWMMLLNGVLLGVIGAACWQAGMSVKLWSFVAPHGTLELPAIFIAGGAGLRVARAWLFPGLLPRRESLARGGGAAVRLLLGTIPMLVVAGIIEGFLSPADFPSSVKFLFGGAMFALLIAYLGMKPKPAAAR